MKFNDNFNEMLVILKNKEPEDNDNPEVIEEPIVTDKFADGLNDIMNTMSITPEIDTSSDTTVPAEDIDDEPDEDSAEDDEEVETDDEEVETDDGNLSVGDGQVGFELKDDKLHIAFDGTDIWLNKEALTALKSFLKTCE